MATLVAIAPVHREWLEGAFLGCWVSVIACAVAVFLPGGVSARGALALSLNAGFWSGAVVAVAGSHFDLLMAVLCVLVVVPGAWIIGARVPIAVKVVSSWLIAVAILAATLQLLPVTPGYLPDHME
jgi:hypothetical protein